MRMLVISIATFFENQIHLPAQINSKSMHKSKYSVLSLLQIHRAWRIWVSAFATVLNAKRCMATISRASCAQTHASNLRARSFQVRKRLLLQHLQTQTMAKCIFRLRGHWIHCALLKQVGLNSLDTASHISIIEHCDLIAFMHSMLHSCVYLT